MIFIRLKLSHNPREVTFIWEGYGEVMDICYLLKVFSWTLEVNFYLGSLWWNTECYLFQIVS